MPTINVEVTVQLAINVKPGTETVQIVDQVLNELDYKFTSQTKDAKIVNTEIVDSKILEDELPWHDQNYLKGE